MGVARHRFAIALVCFLPVVAAIFVGLRLLSRWRRGVKSGLDDWLLVVAVILSFGLIGPSVLYLQIMHIGYHAWEIPQTTADLTNRDNKQFNAVLLSFNLLSIPILPLAKASIIIILLKVGKILKPLRQALHAVFIFNAGACLIPWAVLIFMCPPTDGAGWSTRTFGNLQCISRDGQGHILLFINCANLLTDVVVFPVPFFIMRELMSTSWRSKLMFLLTFASSLCVTALSAVKIYVTFRDRIRLVDNPDWAYSLEYCITHGEGVVGIIVACVPTLRGLVSRGPKSRQDGSNPNSAYASYIPSNQYTSIAAGRVNSTPSDIYRFWSRSPIRHNDEHLLKSSDIRLTTVVKASSSPLDEGQTFGRELEGPQNAEDLQSGNLRNSTLWRESEHYPHTFNPTPVLPPLALGRDFR